ncbi:autophagy protein atg9 [Exophiala xenobiotica]|uniref:Autophagy-related protein 9 n=1 Tax=Lithohypha guttulata TaxID=1690604 RepID=A0ABR0K3N9_9EURO|nr:autophagy protein atg9 [Lithohypha guttulata]KAK5326111.1 autophagy protein atg9 [Exophiala xenobiotica]
MTSNLMSRFRPFPDRTAASIYETIREHDEDGNASDEEDFAALPRYRDEHASLASPRSGGNPRRTSHAGEAQENKTARPLGPRSIAATGKSKRSNKKGFGRGNVDVDDPEDDVPASLLIEDTARPRDAPQGRPRNSTGDEVALEHVLHPQWQSSSPGRLQRGEESLPLHVNNRTVIGTNTLATADPKEKAMWRWANVENLDNFLADVYDYYILRGYWSIILKRVLNLLTVAFVIGFCLFLTQCIDYGRIKGSTKLSQILVKRCTARMGFVPNAILWLTTFVCITRCFQYLLDLRRLRRLHDFYLHLLDIPESEIQSISWQEVVGRLMALRDSNPNIRTSQNPQSKRFLFTQSKQRMDAHDIANRLMRKDNYMIAMINKQVLDTTLALPILGSRQFFTRTLEWHLNYCIMDYVFNSQGQVRQLFLKDTHRKALSEGLRRRFVFAGTTSLLFAPILIVYFVVQNFFQHFNEYQKDPAQIGSRQYNVYAQWRFREFNELWHLFGRRLKMSHPFATRYINQFPKDKTVQAARFVTFISGAIVSILGLATILDQENFLGFEITSGRTTIFYLGIFGSIWAVARGMLPDDNMIYDSSYSMEEVIEFTHYKPTHWDGRLHTIEVKGEFERLYQMQIVVLLEEILSMIFTPFVLWFSLPKCSDRIIDFFREFTVHVDGLGYVCSFAEFNFKKPGQIGTGGNAGTRANNATDIVTQAREEYYADKDDKMVRSYYGFMNDYTRNPKADVRLQYGRSNRSKPFHMPPAIPGILSPPLHRDGQNYEHEQSITGHRQDSRSQIGGETFRVGTSSPPQSLLLDDHHLPGTGSQAIMSPPSSRSRRSAAKSRILPGLSDTMISTAVKEEDEEDLQNGSAKRPVVGSQTGQSGGDLGSWKYDDDLDGESDDEEDPEAVAQGGGVLGLIRQFQKAHDDDKRGGAGV